MDIFLPKGFEAGMAKPRASRIMRAQQLCVEADGTYYPVLRRWPTGFAVSAVDVPALQGVVTLYDGADSLGECLITKSERTDDEKIFTFKRASSFNYASAAEFEGGAQMETGSR